MADSTHLVPSKGLISALAVIVVALTALSTYLLCVVVADGFGAKGAADQPSVQQSAQNGAAESSERSKGLLLEYEPLAPENADGLKLPFTYSTAMGAVTLITYPSFSFSFPGTWSVERETVQGAFEEVALQRNGTGLSVNYSYGAEGHGPASVRLVSIKKVADSAFWPDFVQGTDHAGLGPFMVAEVVLSGANAEGVERELTCYAVVPESALGPDAPGMDITTGVPSFEYSGSVAFWSLVPDAGMTDDQRSEVIAILSSFTNGVSEEEYWRRAETPAARAS